MFPSGMVWVGPGTESGSSVRVASPAFSTTRISTGGAVEGVVAAQPSASPSKKTSAAPRAAAG